MMRRAVQLSVSIVLSVAASALAQGAQPQTKFSPVKALAFSPDGESLAVANGDNSLVIWNVRAREKKLVREKTSVRRLAYSPRGDVLAVVVGKVVSLLDPA